MVHTDDEIYRPSNQVIDMLLDISKNGVLQLNIGPKASGEIPQEVQDIIREIGAWLETNGEEVRHSPMERKARTRTPIAEVAWRSGGILQRISASHAARIAASYMCRC